MEGDDDKLLEVNGGLRLPRNVGVGQSLVERTGERWNTLPGVEEHLREMKVPDLKEPSIEAPEVTPELLLTTDPKEYTRLFSATRAWYGYATRLLARTNAALLEVQNQLENLEAELRKKIRDANKKMPKADRMTSEQLSDEVATDPDWQGIKLREQKFRQYKLEIGAWYDDLDRQLKLVSRQVEVRREDFSGGRNEQNMPGRQRGGFDAYRSREP